MNQLIEIPESRATLTFEYTPSRISAPIRVVIIEGIPHFSARDMCAAMKWPQSALETSFVLDYPQNAKRIVDETAEGEVSNGVYLSPVACWAWTHQVDARRGQPLAAWARRVARDLCPTPREGDPAIFLTMTADGRMPPKPLKYSGRRSEWHELKDSPAFFTALEERVARKMGGVPIGDAQ